MAARAKLTDKQKKQIIARYVEIQNYKQVGREFGISDVAVRNIVKATPGTSQMLAEKKEQNTQDALDYLNSRRDKFRDVIDICYDILTDPNRYNRASVQSVATTMGILIDKYINLAQIMSNGSGANNELLQSLYDLETEKRDNGG